MPKGTKSCFVIAPIGDRGSPIRERSDYVLKHVIGPVVAEFGYEAERGDEVVGPDHDIMTNVLPRIMEDHLVVADLTQDNPNVYYELAIRHAAAKPLLQIADEKRQGNLPFDVEQLSVIFFNHEDRGSVETAQTAIRRNLIEIQEGRWATRAPLTQLADVLSSIAALLWPPTLDVPNLKMAIRSVKRIRKMIASEDRSQPHLKQLQLSLESMVRHAEQPRTLTRRRADRS